jgi:hypothetical protein
MALYHVHANYIRQGSHAEGAQGFARYLSREWRGEASQVRRYLERDGGQGKDDLVASGSARLPRWAKDGEHFFAMADRYERVGWVVARHLQVALPRELSPEMRLDLADDLREVTVGRFPHVWAIHEPEARDGSGAQPHLHILFSPRREDVELDRTPAKWFAKAAAQGQDPLSGGVRKDRTWDKKGMLYDLRAAVALMTNAALAREGVEVAVSEKCLAAQGFSRRPIAYTRDTHAQTIAYRAELQASGVLAYEQRATYAGWQAQALTLMSLDRQYITDLCRDHVWRFDRSPARQQERDASMQRAFALAAVESARAFRDTRQRQAPRITAAQHRQRMQALRPRQQEEPEAGSALTIRLFEDEERQRQRQAGLSW